MNTPSAEARSNVLALLDDVACGAALLEISSALARLTRRELAVVYVENQRALHAAALPFAQVLAAHAAQWRPLQASEVEQGFRTQAARLRELVSRIALRDAVHCTLSIQRGSLGDAAAAMQAETDLLLLAGAAPFRPSTAPVARRRPVVALIAGDAAPDPRAQQVATELAQALSGVLELARGTAAAALLQPGVAGGATLRADLLVMPRGALDAQRLAQLHCPVLLVG